MDANDLRNLLLIGVIGISAVLIFELVQVQQEIQPVISLADKVDRLTNALGVK